MWRSTDGKKGDEHGAEWFRFYNRIARVNYGSASTSALICCGVL